MKVLLPLFFLLAGTLCAQDRASVPGPGAIGDTFEITELDVRLFDWEYCFVGSSLYEKVSTRPRTSLWKKIAEIPVSVLAFESGRTSSDSILLLWTGEAEYRFNLKRATLEKVDAHGLLSSFLAWPVVSAVAGREWSTCGSDGAIERTHDVIEDPVPSLQHEVQAATDDRGRRGLVNGVDRDEITWVLRTVNLDPHRIPSLQEFSFDADDLLGYDMRVATDIGLFDRWKDRKDVPLLYLLFAVAANSDIYLDLPEKIDRIGPEITGPALLALSRRYLSIMYYGHTVTLINEVGDSLFISYPTGRDLTTLIPFWEIRYDDTEFRCFDPKLSRLLTRMLPDRRTEYLREPEEKVELLYAVAWQMGLGRWE